MFFQELESYGERIAALQEDHSSITYSSLSERADRLSELLAQSKGGLIFLLCRNNIPTLISYIAALRSSSAVLLLDAQLDGELLDQLVRLYVPECIIKDGNVEHRYSSSGSVHPDLKLLLTTSGTTGSPRLVRLNSGNIDANSQAIAQYLDLTQEERPITSLPFHYSYGLSVINSHLRVGSTILLTDSSLVSRAFWNYFAAERGTSLAGVPYSYSIMQRLKIFRMSLPHWKTLTQAGGKLSPEVALEFAQNASKRNMRFFLMYGQTEATARISYVPYQRAIEKHDSAGIAIPGGALFLENENRSRIEDPGIQGEVLYQGPNVMMGYADSRADLVKGDELHGLLRTGDLAYFDEERYLHISGRLKRFLKIQGNRLNLDELESFLKSQGIECACGGVDDHLCIAVADKNHSPTEVCQLISKKFRIHPTVVQAWKVPEIRRNKHGKILYGEMFDKIIGAK